MPNWCDTSYKCVGDLKEVKSLHKVLKYMEKRKTSILKNGFGKMWLGNLVTNSVEIGKSHAAVGR